MSINVQTLHLPRAWRATHGGHRWWRLLAAGMLLIVVLATIIAYLIDEPLRRQMEARINERLTGYEARVARLSFHPLGFSITLTDLSLRQIAHPDPPVANFSKLKASVHWRALLNLRLVADFELVQPAIHVDRRKLEAEIDDEVNIEDKGWQRALEAIYPLKVNFLTIRDGSLTYIERDGKNPLRMTQLNATASNIRNVQSPDRKYPSTIKLRSRVFDSGELTVNGHADFMAEPYAGIDGDVRLQHIELKKLRPVAVQANLHVSGGVLDAEGHVEYAPKIKDIHLKAATIRGIAVDYVHSPVTAVAERKRLETAREVAEDEFAGKDRTMLTIDKLTVADATVGYVNEATDPRYRVFLSNGKLEVSRFSNRSPKDYTNVKISGSLMGAGETWAMISAQPAAPQSEMDFWVEIKPTSLRSLNDVLRAYGGFDVAQGSLEFYGELHAHGGMMSGYVKPLLSEMEVYDRRQDADKPLLARLYELLIGGAATVLENREGNVAARAGVYGSINDPDVSIWEFAFGLIKNAIFSSVLPGFEEAVRRKPEKSNDGASK